jgi:Flp pilus assembly protein TadG
MRTNPRVNMVSGRKLRKGAAVVELAAVLPILLLLFAAGVDFARVYYFAQVIANGARMGAAYASNPDVADRSPYESAVEATHAALKDLKPDPDVTVSDGKDSAGNSYAQVKVEYNYRPITRFAGLPSVQVLTSTARARLYPAAVIDKEGT